MKKYFLLIIFASMSVGLYAQDYNDYLMEARNYLQSGQVEKAKSSYNMYKKMTGKADYEFESKLKSQENNNDRKVTVRSSASATTTVNVVRHADGSISTYPVDNSTSLSQAKRQIRIGDKLNGGRVCYINESAGFGWIIDIEESKHAQHQGSIFGHSSNEGWRKPSVDECKTIYKNRYALGLNDTYWTSTRSKKVANWEFYYTFNFNTGKEKSTDESKDYPHIYIKNFYLNELN